VHAIILDAEAIPLVDVTAAGMLAEFARELRAGRAVLVHPLADQRRPRTGQGPQRLVLYGLCYGNGRALGAVITGTQLVRIKDGGRVGGKACWAMLVRTLLMPLLFVVVVVGALGGGGGSPSGSLARTSIDPAATRQLHAAGIR
jgi:hypothetical protein